MLENVSELHVHVLYRIIADGKIVLTFNFDKILNIKIKVPNDIIFIERK